MKVVIVGQGYVGLPLAMSICEAGHDVIGFDLNSKDEQGRGRACVHFG